MTLAIADYDKTIEYKSNYADAYCNRGLFSEKQGKDDLAADSTRDIQC